MRARFLNQPNEAGRLGDVINDQLVEAVGWAEFRAAVAFGKRSGLLRVAPHLSSFAERGSVRMSIGVDLLGTSKEGLEILLEAVVSKGGRVWVFRNEHAMRPTFHPKIYLFKKPDAALLVVGSGNFTAGGLYSNYEGNLILELDLEAESDRELLADVEQTLDEWSDPDSELVRPLDAGLIAEMVEGGIVTSEVQTRGDEATERERRETSTGGEARRVFGRQRVPGPPAVARQSVRQRARQRRRRTPTESTRGPVVWRKKLSATDAQRQPGHAVGGVRLTQARFEDESGERIDQTTYFRYVLFNDFGWTTTKTEPPVEQAMVLFDVTLLGISHGQIELAVSHKPSGEAGQGNYTSQLHLGELAATLREEVDITGRTLTLYGPPSGEREPFFIEVS